MRSKDVVSIVVVVAAVGLAGQPAHATESYGYTETLVGWSEDGDSYAVVRGAGPSEPAALEVRQLVPGKPDKVVATWTADDKGVPEDLDDKPGVERIDIEKWAPIKKFKLKRIQAASRTRFKAELELGTVGKRLDRYTCKDFGWTLKRKGEAKPITQVKASKGTCFQMLGGYVHPNGKRALVKLTESSFSDADEAGEASSSSEDITHFVLVALPAKP